MPGNDARAGAGRGVAPLSEPAASDGSASAQLGGGGIGGADPRGEPLVKDIIELFHAKVVHVEKRPD